MSTSDKEEVAEQDAGAHGTVQCARKRKGRLPSVPPITPLHDPKVGTIVWAKVKNARWWPAVIVDKDDCGKLAAVGHTVGRGAAHYVYWYGDGRVSPVAMSKLVEFTEGYKRFKSPPGRQSFKSGVYLAISELRKLQMLNMDDWDPTKAFLWADRGFCLTDECQDIVQTHGIISDHVQEKLHSLREKYEDECESDGESECNTTDSGPPPEISFQERELISSVRNNNITLADICLACVSSVNAKQDHPLFNGSICELCMEILLERSFSIGLDLVAFHCAVCMSLGNLIVCSQPHCYRAYCIKCIELKAALGVIGIIRESDPWHCFLCAPYTPEMHGLLEPRLNWKMNLWTLFHPDSLNSVSLIEMSLRILCCDGSSETVLTVLSNLASLGISVDTLILFKFDSKELSNLKSALPQKVVLKNSISEHMDYETLSELTPVHIVIGSSQAKEKELLGANFFTFLSIVSMIRILMNACSVQCKIPLMWMFEVASPFFDDYNILISRYLEFDPGSWAKRQSKGKNNLSLVWTNIHVLWQFLEGDGVFHQQRMSLEEKPCTRTGRGHSFQAQMEMSNNSGQNKNKAGECSVLEGIKRKRRKIQQTTHLYVTRSKFSIN